MLRRVHFRGAPITRSWLLGAIAAVAGVCVWQACLVGTAAAATGRIAYEAAPSEEVWTAETTGGDRVALAPGSQPLIAPNGTLVAIVPKESSIYTYSGPALALYSTLGPAPIEIGEAPTTQMQPEAFSPDSKYLAVALTTNNAQGFPAAAGSGIGVLDTETDAFTVIGHGLVSGASFNPDGSDELVYGSASSVGLNARSNLYIWAPGYPAPRQITTDGRSLKPVWGPQYIAYAHEHPRRGTDPELQVWLRAASGAATQLTHVRFGSLVEGLEPVAFSQSGSTLVADLDGEDLSQPWVVSVPSGREHPVRVGHDGIVSAAGISADGSTLLLIASLGAGSPASVMTEAVSGGRAKLVAAHADAASWSE